MLANMLAGGDLDPSKAKGVFYLCGPTWPVPDVYEALIKSLNTYAGKSRDDAAIYLEDLKEEERYVLEVRIYWISPGEHRLIKVYTGVLVMENGCYKQVETIVLGYIEVISRFNHIFGYIRMNQSPCIMRNSKIR